MATKKTTKKPASKSAKKPAPESAKKPAPKSAKKAASKSPKKAAPKKAAGATSARMKQIVQKHDELYGKDYFTPTDVVCPLCGDGVIVPKRGRFGAEWRCNAEVRPMCAFKVETKPTGATCTFVRNGKPCGALMVAGTKTIPDRCSDKSCPNRNPHKL